MNERSYGKILVAVEEGVCTITLNYPQRRNAIGQQMVNEILWALSDASEDDAVRTVVITGAGDKAFCAGGDFAQMTSGGDGAELEFKGDYADLLLAMIRSPKPIIARVNGHAMGGGLGLVAASTFAVGVEGAKLGTPEVNVGLFPMMIMAVLRRLMSHRRMMEMMLFGERLEAKQAVIDGLLNRAVPPEELDAAVAEIAAKIGSKSPITLKIGLEAIADQADLDLEAALPMLKERLGRCLATEDAAEGLTAFLKKREPVWKGR
ncbi:enoyl-CoA hydratase/isomerase family protein [Endomicrobium sp. AH-315-J14]|nr:enoyl-CoA hydratase/isomerase family protein [Endomicrobium sp. AH-315-J14]